MSHITTQSSAPKHPSEMSAAERLESIQRWVEEQKYVQPGEGGTLPGGPRGVATLAFGGRMGYTDQPQYTAPIGPPSYETATQQPVEKKKGPVKRWLEKRRDSKTSNEKKNGSG